MDPIWQGFSLSVKEWIERTQRRTSVNARLLNVTSKYNHSPMPVDGHRGMIVSLQATLSY
jgi:hypothetical protein